MNILNRTRLIFETVKIEHTIFALPFAYLGLVLAEEGWPRFFTWCWVTLAMAGLRTAGMLFNRIFDAETDRLNPRTRERSIPSGRLSHRAAWVGAAISSVAYFFAAYKLNQLCFALAPLPYILAMFYPFLKRLTALCHFGIGLILSGAPLGGWMAARGELRGAPFLVSAAVLFWVAGFDIIYALQDTEFDRTHHLFSMPALFGMETAMRISAAFHAVTMLCLAAFGWFAGMGWIYGAGMSVIALFLVREHMLIFRHGLRRLSEAFFTLNASVSIGIFLFTLADLLVAG